MFPSSVLTIDELASHLFPKLTTLKFPRHPMGHGRECAYEMGLAREESYRVGEAGMRADRAGFGRTMRCRGDD